MHAFGAPYSIMLLEVNATGMYDTAAEEMGKLFVSTELGGGGTARASTVAVAKRGIDNILRHAGVVAGEPQIGETVSLDMPDDRCFVSSETPGLLEPCVDLGADVRAGEVIARVYDPNRTGSPPFEYRSPPGRAPDGPSFPGADRHGRCRGGGRCPRLRDALFTRIQVTSVCNTVSVRRSPVKQNGRINKNSVRDSRTSVTFVASHERVGMNFLAGTIGSMAATTNAVLDALRSEGVRHVDMPLTAERVWRAIATR